MKPHAKGSSSDTAPKRPACGLLRTMMLAGIGLFALLGDEVQAAYERGVQREGHRKPSSNRQGADVSQPIFTEWETTLAKLNLPTKSDIDALTRQMSALEAQIDQIAARRAASRSKE